MLNTHVLSAAGGGTGREGGPTNRQRSKRADRQNTFPEQQHNTASRGRHTRGHHLLMLRLNSTATTIIHPMTS